MRRTGALAMMAMLYGFGLANDGLLSQATGVSLSSGLDAVESANLKAFMSETYEVKVREGELGVVRITRDRLVNYSTWDDVEYLLDVTRHFENDAIRLVLSEVNRCVVENGATLMDRAEYEQQLTGNSLEDLRKRGPSLMWSQGSEVVWRFLPLDDALYARVRRIMRKYVGGLEYDEGPMTLRVERVYVYEGAGVEAREVSIRELIAEPEKWAGRRVRVKGRLLHGVGNEVVLFDADRRKIQLEDPMGKLRRIWTGVVVRIDANFVRRGDGEAANALTRITSAEVLGLW